MAVALFHLVSAIATSLKGGGGTRGHNDGTRAQSLRRQTARHDLAHIVAGPPPLYVRIGTHDSASTLYNGCFALGTQESS